MWPCASCLARNSIRMAGNNAHQGVVAITSGKHYNDLDDVVSAKRGEYSLIVVLDGIEDPHNLGVLAHRRRLRSRWSGNSGRRRAAGVTATVTKASAGASEHLPIAKVTNIARTLEDLRKNICGLSASMNAVSKIYDALDYNMDCAIVLGSEGKGVHYWWRKSVTFWSPFPCWGKGACP